jgi:hypothetical protein
MAKIYSIFIMLLFFVPTKANSHNKSDSLSLYKNLSFPYQPDLHYSLSEFPSDQFSAVSENDPDTDQEIGKATAAFDALEQTGNFTSTINPNEIYIIEWIKYIIYDCLNSELEKYFI